MKTLVNEVRCRFFAVSENESFARSMAVTFASQASPTITQLADIKCAVSEAVTNCIVHAYPNGGGTVEMNMRRYDNGEIVLTVKDKGVGIADVAAAREPLYTTDTTGERSGMGFSIMESMTDSLKVKSTPGKGTTVTMKIKVGAGS
ncbi:MAG: anti-sigma F factor [Clostridia bacterium]|nr:anti-sigma F factor [Clostridia bacterium]